MNPRDSEQSSPIPVSRRRAVRLDAPPALGVIFSDQRIVAKVLDMGPGGLGLRSNTSLETGATYEVTLMLGSGVQPCAVKVAHCQLMNTGHWLVGLAFVLDHRRAEIERFVDTLISARIEFS
jgi:hypothetical protein